MIDIIYYAHCMTTYNTPQEQEELALLKAHFDNGLIFNPNRDWIQFDTNPMKLCLELVADDIITGVAFGTVDGGYVGAGVYAEIRAAQKRYKPVYEIRSGNVLELHGELQLVKRDKAQHWARVL